VGPIHNYTVFWVTVVIVLVIGLGALIIYKSRR
jgi:hypothetical protein